MDIGGGWKNPAEAARLRKLANQERGRRDDAPWRTQWRVIREHFTQSQMARILGTNATTLSKWENGHAVPNTMCQRLIELFYQREFGGGASVPAIGGPGEVTDPVTALQEAARALLPAGDRPAEACEWCPRPETQIDSDTLRPVPLKLVVLRGRDGREYEARARVCSSCRSGLEKFGWHLPTVLRAALFLALAQRPRMDAIEEADVH